MKVADAVPVVGQRDARVHHPLCLEENKKAQISPTHMCTKVMAPGPGWSLDGRLVTQRSAHLRPLVSVVAHDEAEQQAGHHNVPQPEHGEVAAVGERAGYFPQLLLVLS